MDGSTEVASDHGGEAHGDEGHHHRSGWPIVAGLGAGALYLGVGLTLVGLDLVPSVVPLAAGVLGGVGLVVGLAGWAYQAFIADYWASHGPARTDIYTAGMILFLVSDVATFSAGFVYYFFIRVGPWPPDHLPPLLGSLVVINTLLLVASSVTLHYGHEALERGDRRRFLGLLGVTTLLGVIFVGGQAIEYYEFVVADGFTLSTGVFASAFYGLTGLHGLHVSLGVLLLAIALGRALRGHYSAERDAAIRTVALYWHFVDVVWVFLVVVLYAGAVL